MAENTKPQPEATEETDTEIEEAEVEAHAASVLPLQGLSTPEPDGANKPVTVVSLLC